MTTSVTARAPAEVDVLPSLFTTWVVLGLFLDGWAHNAGKPEDFWTPWHAVLYSGFIAGFISFAWRRRQPDRAAVSEDPREERLALIGFVAFAIGGAGDAVWHTLFGVEEDAASLLSPTHLMLMIAGLVLVTGPLREDIGRAAAASWRRFWHVALAATLALAVVSFFVQFASPLHVFDTSVYTSGEEFASVRGVLHVLLTNVLFVAAVGWLLGRWPAPAVGTFTLVLGGTGLLMVSLEGFEHALLAAGPLAGGVVADALVAVGQRRAVVLTVTPLVTWGVWFLAAASTFGLAWEIEFWTGSLVLAALTGVAVEALVRAQPAATD